MADPNLSLQLDLFQLEPVTPRVKARRQRRAAGPISQEDLFTLVKRTERVKRKRPNRSLGDGLEQARILAQERGGDCVSNVYKSVQDAMQWRCVNGHEFSMRLAKVKDGGWCPRCRVWRREEVCRLVLERLYETPFPQSWPKWLIGRNGRQVSLDGYNVALRLAFEYQGQQHYHNISWFHRTANSLEIRRELDARKQWQCKRHNVLLLVIPYWIELEDTPDWIFNELKEIGAPSPKNLPSMVYPLSPHGVKRLQSLRELAFSRKGELLDTEYKGIRKKHRFRCELGHEWQTLIGTVEKGSWCPQCANRRISQAQLLSDGLERVRKAAIDRGGECFIDEYHGSNTRCRVRCNQGHEWEPTARSILCGQWCKKCTSLVRRVTIDKVRAIAETWGGECLSECYINRYTQLRWCCSDGHEWNASYADIRSGKWCPACARTKERAVRIQESTTGIEEMCNIAKARGGECLSSVYTNQYSKLRWRCATGHEWMAIPNNIKRGTWCPECAKKQCGSYRRLTIEKMRSVAKTRGGECLSELYTNQNSNLRWRCTIGHEWEAAAGNIKQGSWCPTCAVIKNGNARRLTIDAMRELAKIRGGECLSERSVPTREKLRWRCANGHEFTAKARDVNSGKWCPVCGRIKGGLVRRTQVVEMKQIAKERGGECLSVSCNSAHEKLLWRCSVGHEWLAAPTDIKGGSWCRKCATLKNALTARLTIENMKKIANKRGGECLSDTYTRIDYKLRWRCADKHEWEAVPNNVIHKSSWCPTCARKRVWVTRRAKASPTA